MENTVELNIFLFALIGTLSMLVFSTGFILLFRLYKKRIEREQEALREAEVNFERQINEASMKAEQQERMQIAMDLHDEIGALMTVLKINNHNAKNEAQDNLPLFRVLNEASGLIEQTADSIRNISNRISPPTLAKLGLDVTLNELINTINSTGKIQINYLSQLENRRFKIAAELNLYRILKETINNILKHGQTTELSIQANQSTEFVEFEFSYQGHGLTNEQVNELLRVSDRNGLKSIQSRVNNLNATISYLCLENGKATIHLKIPFHAIKN